MFVKNPLIHVRAHAKIRDKSGTRKYEGIIVLAPVRHKGLRATLVDIHRNRRYYDFLRNHIIKKEWDLSRLPISRDMPRKEVLRLLAEIGMIVKREDLPRRVRYHCLLDEKPSEGIPTKLFKVKGAGGFVVNKNYRFVASFKKPKPMYKKTEKDPRDGIRCYDPGGTCLDPKDSAFLLGAPAFWIRDSGTGIRWPYWLREKDGVFFSSLKRGQPLEALKKGSADPFLSCELIGTPESFEKRRRQWEKTIQDAKRHFARHKYAVLPSLIPRPHLEALRRYYRELIREGYIGKLNDYSVSRCFSMHNEKVTSFFHHRLTSIVSQVIGKPIKPSYVFSRCYVEGTSLKKHVDRDQSAVAVSMLLDYEPESDHDSPWPLFIQKNGKARTTYKISQKIGDLVLFRGTQMPHFRKKLPPHHRSTSIIFNYVPESFSGNLY